MSLLQLQTAQFSEVSAYIGLSNLHCSMGSVFSIGSTLSAGGRALFDFEDFAFGCFVGWSSGGKSFAFHF